MMKFIAPLLKRVQKAVRSEPDLSHVGEETVGGVTRRASSPWGRRRLGFRRSNHPWVRSAFQRLTLHSYQWEDPSRFFVFA